MDKTIDKGDVPTSESSGESDAVPFLRYQKVAERLSLPLIASDIRVNPLDDAAWTMSTVASAGKIGKEKRAVLERALVVTPTSVDFGELTAGGDIEFSYGDASARRVQWVGDLTDWHRNPAVMEKTGDVFHVAFSWSDKQDAYAFEVGERQIPDPENGDRLLITKHGVASLFPFRSFRRVLALFNTGHEPIPLLLEPAQSWFQVSPRKCIVPPRSAIAVSLDPLVATLSPGCHRGYLQILLGERRNQSLVQAINISLTLKPAPFHVWPLDSATTLNGIWPRGKTADIPLVFESQGAGRADILIYNHGDGALHTVTLTGDSAPAPRRHRVVLPFDLLATPRNKSGSCRLSIDTQNAVWDRRFYEITVNYRQFFLLKRPAMLHFKRFSDEGEGEALLFVSRSDGAMPDLAFELPERLQGRIEVYPLGAGCWRFSANRRNFPNERDIEESILLEDRLSGCRDRLRVCVEVVP